MREYVINFWLWWYKVQAVEWLKQALNRALFWLHYTNTLVMAQNLFVPLFQDNSAIGKMLSFPIRFVWVWVGGMISAAFTLPFLLIYLGLVMLPVFATYFFILGLSRLI